MRAKLTARMAEPLPSSRPVDGISDQPIAANPGTRVRPRGLRLFRALSGMARTLAATGQAAFAATLIAEAPASLVGIALARSTTAFHYEKASGSVWNGRMTGVVVRGLSIGEVRFKIEAGSLILGRLAATIEANGRGVRARGWVAGDLSGALTGRNITADIALEEFRGMRLLGAPLEGKAFVRLNAFAGSLRGCTHAEGAISTDALVSVARRFNRKGFPLAGAIRCENGALALPLSGSAEGVRADTTLLFDKRGRIVSKSAVETQDNALASALRTLGFRNDNGVWRFETSLQVQGGPT